ncbi:hypothetical protein ABPG72_003434 [Tetrahymena utriculariae]
MSQSPPHAFHYKLHEDVRKLLENLYLKKIGKNNERLNSQVLNMISDVFDGKKQQLKQNQISQLKQRLETLCNSQSDQASPVKNVYISKYQHQEEQADNKQDDSQIKLPKLFKTRDASNTLYQKYQHNHEQRINTQEKTNLNSQRQQSPQISLYQREQAFKAYCNPYIETPKNNNKDRNASYDEYNKIKRQELKRKFLQNGRQSNNSSPSHCFLNDEKYKLNQKASQSFNNSPQRPQFQINHYKNLSKQEGVQLDRSNQQLLKPKEGYVDDNIKQNINQNQKSQKRNKLIFLSSQKAEAPKNIFVNNSQTLINEFTDDVIQTKQLSTKNKVNQVNDHISKELFKPNQYYAKTNNISSQQILVEISKNQQPQTNYFQNQTSDLKNKYINIKERGFSQNSNNRDLNFSLIVNQNNANNLHQQKNNLNNSMIVMQESNHVPNVLNQSLQNISTHNNFLKDIKSTQDYLKNHNNDIWTLIVRFNIQKEEDKKKKELLKQQELNNKIKEDLEKQIIEKQQNAKTQFMIDQEYQQINKKQLVQMNEIQLNQKQEELYKKRIQTQLLEEQIYEKQEQQKKEKKQIEQDNLKLIQDLQKQQNDEDIQKKNQIKKYKQLYEGIKQDYFERFKRVNMNETNEDSKIAFEKKRIATYVKELENQKQLGTSNEQRYQGVDKLIKREKIKPVDQEILQDWAKQINQKQIIIKLEKDQQKKIFEEYLEQCEKNEEQDRRKEIEYKVKVALNHQSIKEQIDKKMSSKIPEASNFDIQNNLSILREIDEYIKNAQE